MGRRKFWGWGDEEAGPDARQAQGIADTLAKRFENVVVHKGTGQNHLVFNRLVIRIKGTSGDSLK